jgi:hypothetical protein
VCQIDLGQGVHRMTSRSVTRGVWPRWSSALLFAIALVAGITLGVGCTSNPQAGQPVMDYSILLTNLRVSSLLLTEAGEISQPFFGVKGRIVRANGGDIQVFEYKTPEAMEAESRYVSPDGYTFKTDSRVTSVEWIAPPHFYKAGRVIVIYVGSDLLMTDFLDKTLGRQFAGAPMK